MAATSNVFAKLFATTLIPTTCNDIFSLRKAYLAATLYFSQRHMLLQKPIFLVVNSLFLVFDYWLSCFMQYAFIFDFVIVVESVSSMNVRFVVDTDTCVHNRLINFMTSLSAL